MKKKLIAVFGILALAALPAVYAAAQEMDEAQGMDESAAWQDGRPRHTGGGQAAVRTRREATMVRRGRGGQEDMKGARGPMGGPGFMDEEAVIALIKKHDPVFSARLDELKKAARPKYNMVLMMARRGLGPAMMEEDESLAAAAVKAVSLEFHTKELAMKYNKAGGSDKAGIKADLKAKLAELFELRLKGQELRVKRMEKDLAGLKSNLETRRANKARIVDQRLEQLTGEGYGW